MTMTWSGFFTTVLFVSLQIEPYDAECEDFHCVDDECSNDGLCTNGCTQWYTPIYADDTESALNCSLYIPEYNITSECYIASHDHNSVKFSIEMDTQIPDNLAGYYRYSIQYRPHNSNRYKSVSSGIRHNSHQRRKTEVVNIKLKKNKLHWFRVSLKRKQNGQSSSGAPSQPMALYISHKEKLEKADDKIIPLVVLLTIFVTATVVLGTLANYLGRKRAEATENNGAKVSNLGSDESASNASIISMASREGGGYKHGGAIPCTPTSLRYQQANQSLDDAAVNGGTANESHFLYHDDFELEARPTGNGSTPLPEVEDSPAVTRLTLEDSFVSTQSAVTGRNIQLTVQDEPSVNAPTGKKTKPKRRSKTQECSYSDGQDRKKSSKPRRKTQEFDTDMVSSDVSQDQAMANERLGENNTQQNTWDEEYTA